MAAFGCIRKTFLATAILQLIAIFERQVLDFLGYMWLCIGLNFVHVICLILAIFGALQHRIPYVVLGIVWNLLWIGWNVFIICLYLEVGLLRKDMPILNLGTGTSNWWNVNGPGCSATYDFSSVDPVTFRAKVVKVENCILAYHYIEIVHSAVQIILSIFGLILAAVLVHLYRGKTASSSDDMIKPVPIPGYTLSLQHSLPVDNFSQPGSRPPASAAIRNGTYDRVSKRTREPAVAETGTTRSGRSGGSSSRRKSARPPQETSTAYRPQPGVDNIRVSTMIPKNIQNNFAREQDGTSIYGAYGPTTAKRESSPQRRPYTCYNPGSVSPYQSRTATEASF